AKPRRPGGGVRAGPAGAGSGAGLGNAASAALTWATLTMRRSTSRPRPARNADSTLRTTCLGCNASVARTWISAIWPSRSVTTRAETMPAREQSRRSAPATSGDRGDAMLMGAPWNVRWQVITVECGAPDANAQQESAERRTTRVDAASGATGGAWAGKRGRGRPRARSAGGGRRRRRAGRGRSPSAPIGARVAAAPVAGPGARNLCSPDRIGEGDARKRHGNGHARERRVETLVIIGSGPAAWTAAIYAARANLRPLVFEGEPQGTQLPGGQLMNTTEIENFPGFPDGITGPELMERMKAQALRFGARAVMENVVGVDFSEHPFRIRPHYSEEVQALAVIVATGASAKWLGVPNEERLARSGGGVSACAVCDAALPIYRDKRLAG